MSGRLTAAMETNRSDSGSGGFSGEIGGFFPCLGGFFPDSGGFFFENPPENTFNLISIFNFDSYLSFLMLFRWILFGKVIL